MTATNTTQLGLYDARPATAVNLEALRKQLIEVEERIMRVAPAHTRHGQFGDDIEAACRSRQVPASLKNERKRLRELVSAARAAAANLAMAVPVPEKFTLSILRKDDDNRMEWYFDSLEQVTHALGHCVDHGAHVAFVEQRNAKRPDYVSDAEELRVWLAFEYLTEAED